ncbi:unnamed protein product [Anisakis simplex]|uniref:VWFA domain-containing protein n=1 Tax=Anisakis simplex TaxID=6269 RepID=A0A0M3KGR4_ANISI|nr:unnamed protein product [Anisakis simplex]
MSDQRCDIASSGDAIETLKLNRKVPLTAGAAISLSIVCIALTLPGAELTIPSQKEKSHSMMLSLSTNQSHPSTQQAPPCFDYFVFVVDNSNVTASNYNKIVQSLTYITNKWKLNEKLQLTAATAAGDSTEAMPFTKNLTEWKELLIGLINTLPSSDPATTPIQLADGISFEYCDSDSEFKIAQGGSVKFIIFTSFSCANIAGFQLLALKAYESELLWWNFDKL